MDPLQSLRENIRAYINSAGYRSVELFAHENDLEKSTLSRILSGKREPKIGTLLGIAEALGVTLDVLCYGHANPGAKLADSDFSRYKPTRTKHDGEKPKSARGKKDKKS